MNSFGINTCQKLIPWMLASSMHSGIVASQLFKRVSWAVEWFYVLHFLICVWKHTVAKWPVSSVSPQLVQQRRLAALLDRRIVQFLRLRGRVWPYFPVSVLFDVPGSLNTAFLFISEQDFADFYAVTFNPNLQTILKLKPACVHIL